ncbi:MAG: xylulose 5-phosphate 3-epimerase [Oleiphilaceae bacterium]|nr:xylulose 5-phosphate 3-epimerase [Oleiphilaceae bacterium]
MTSSFPDLKNLERQASISPAFRQWRAGFGVIRHLPETQENLIGMARQLVASGLQPDTETVFQHLISLDHLASAGLWLVAHMTYANRVRLDGRPLAAQDFKTRPEGHSGGSLNMVPAYAGYLALNALTGHTRSWLMGQGHCVSAIEAVNVLTGNLHPEQLERYQGEEGLNRLVRDFYSYEQRPDGRNAAPLGSHVNAHTAGGLMEGGYLGFAELQYSHMPLPGETLVAFLSDGAAEEHCGDWGPRWWRSADNGLALPVMIANGRRIDQRTQLGSPEGLRRFIQQLRLKGFDPRPFDGRDPAAFTHTLFEMETRWTHNEQQRAIGQQHYPLPMPYGIAATVKGYGFAGAGKNRAHNLPLPANPRINGRARDLFNCSTRELWVPPETLVQALSHFCQHKAQGRPLERDHALASRHPDSPVMPELTPGTEACSPMLAIDEYFPALVRLNPNLRPRVGNPDELSSNRLTGVLAALKHRVNEPEDAHEAVHGSIISALNEEAIVSACLANKAGLNLVASYEAFCVRMLGAIRQEITFARYQKAAGRPPQWLGFAIVATSHTWENGKNEHSHQDTTFCEALLGEMNDGIRVLFPADFNSTQALLPSVYHARGQLSCLVVPKKQRPCLFNGEEARTLACQGGLVVDEDNSPGEPILLIANGSYQLSEMIRASERLHDAATPFRLVYVQEPGRFRQARDARERATCISEIALERLCPRRLRYRVVMTHMRPEVFRGHAALLAPDIRHCRTLGYINQGGTFNVDGMLFANRCTWAHALLACAQVLGENPEKWLNHAELEAAEGRAGPNILAL